MFLCSTKAEVVLITSDEVDIFGAALHRTIFVLILHDSLARGFFSFSLLLLMPLRGGAGRDNPQGGYRGCRLLSKSGCGQRLRRWLAN
jgi:hypothetical protein